ncbi:MAG: hypothetical protein AM1032_000159 [Mycoplasmataceae bacterium]|nr:MAG: hypothetical protein AM1032_000159 [Mycoplasmataceae bacterium]
MNNEKQTIDASEYLEQNYPKNGNCIRENESLLINNFGKRRNEINKLNINNLIGEFLIGTLDLTAFTNLKELNCSNNQLTQLILPEQLETLYCSGNQIVNLDLINLTNLICLHCDQNELNELILHNGNKLEDIDVSENNLTYFNCDELNSKNLISLKINNNHLTSFDYYKLNSKTLRYLWIYNNNFEIIDLSVFSHLINLNELSIGNFKKNSNSKLYGSLEALKKCTKLEFLHIFGYGFQVNRGLEYLSDSIKHISFNGLKEISNHYKEKHLLKMLKSWRRSNPQLIENAQMITELAEYEEIGDLITEAFSKIRKLPNHQWWSDPRNQLTFQMLCNEDSVFGFHWFNRRYTIIKKLKAENEEYYQKIEKNEMFEIN